MSGNIGTTNIAELPVTNNIGIVNQPIQSQQSYSQQPQQQMQPQQSYSQNNNARQNVELYIMN
jgi:hypothetical protein